LKVLWAPWRLRYVGGQESSGGGCIFCDKPALKEPDKRREALVLGSDDDVSVIMNLYPYSNAHLLVAPRLHCGDFASLSPAVHTALQKNISRCIGVLTKAYTPAGFNVGMNLGSVAGAGIADHLHWHVVPRWQGDTNFMTVLGDTRVIPEHIEEAFDRLLPLFEEMQ